MTRYAFDGLTAEEGVVLDTSFPEVLARVARTEVELDGIFVVRLWHTQPTTSTGLHSPLYHKAVSLSIKL